MKLKPENRAIEVLKYMLETKSSIVKTAKHFGVSQATIHSDIKTRIVKFADPKDLEKLKIIINNNKTVGLTVDEKEKINSQYNKGRSISSLAKETGHSKTSIKKHIKASRCETNSHQLDVENRMAKVFDYFIRNKDKSFDQICDDLNVDSLEMQMTFNELGRIIMPEQFDIINSRFHIYDEDEEIKKL